MSGGLVDCQWVQVHAVGVKWVVKGSRWAVKG